MYMQVRDRVAVYLSVQLHRPRDLVKAQGDLPEVPHQGGRFFRR
jgi:hypothetical protein